MPGELAARMAALGLRESELVEKFVHGSGPGGQKINKAATTVQLSHPPTGLEVRCQAGRSLVANRIEARRLLCERLEERRNTEREEKARRRWRQQVRHRKPSAAARRKRVDQKRRKGEKKRLRRRPDHE